MWWTLWWTLWQGVPPELRADVWKFLLELYPCTSPLLHRLEYIETASARYSELLDTALDADAAGDEVFRQHRKIIDKDVPRTDRDHPFFAGDDNPNLVALQNILLAHTILDPELGYVQGMNDIAGTILYGEPCHVPPRPPHASADCPRPCVALVSPSVVDTRPCPLLIHTSAHICTPLHP